MLFLDLPEWCVQLSVTFISVIPGRVLDSVGIFWAPPIAPKVTSTALLSAHTCATLRMYPGLRPYCTR